MTNLIEIEKLPAVENLDNIGPEVFVDWYNERKPDIEKQLLKHGAVRFQGVIISSVNDFQQIVNGISENFLNYVDGNSPRIKLSGNVYTSTEYDKNQRITMHNELSYSATWPNKIYFSCLTPAETGGETLLADSRLILQMMNPAIVEEIKAKGITYIRNLHGGTGMGPSWQDTFETNDKAQAEAYCKANNTTIEWRENDTLRVKQFSRGIINHRITGELLWFNQIDQFHPSHLGAELYEVLQSIYEDTSDFPLNVQFGDGTPVTDDLVTEIMQTIDRAVVAPVWNTNEFLVVDNELVCHGRNPYTGERKVLVSMSK